MGAQEKQIKEILETHFFEESKRRILWQHSMTYETV